MKIGVRCRECGLIAEREAEEHSIPVRLASAMKRVYIPLQMKGIYHFTCQHGHENRVAMRSPHWEVLFNAALSAMADGYFREAVATWATSLERFYEFSVRVLCRHAGLCAEDIAAAWSPLAALSERQLGAFVFVHYLVLKKMPSILNPNQSTFRNEVVHRGHIPTEEKALAFGRRVLEIVSEVATEFRTPMRRELLEVINEEQAERLKAIDVGDEPLPTTEVLNIANVSSGSDWPWKQTLEQLLHMTALSKIIEHHENEQPFYRRYIDSDAFGEPIDGNAPG